MSGRSKGLWATKKVAAKLCPECGQKFSKQKMGLHLKERHPEKK